MSRKRAPTPTPALEPPPDDALVVRTSKRGPLSALETATIAQLMTAGHSPHAIAHALGRTTETVRRHLTDAKALLSCLTPEAVLDWATASKVAAARGFHAPAMDLLIAAGVIRSPRITPTDSGSNRGPAVQVNIGFPLPGVPMTPEAKVVEGSRVVGETLEIAPDLG